MSFDYIRNFYRVPVKRGAPVEYMGLRGTVIGSRGVMAESEKDQNSNSVAVRAFLENMSGQLDSALETANARLAQAKEDAEAIKAARIAIQQKIEALELAHNNIARAVAKTVAEYERIATLPERATNALALVPPESPQAPKKAIKAIKDVPLLRQELAKTAITIQNEKPICGVYFLLQDNDVVYVGQSINVLNRVVTHCTDGLKRFNRWCYIDVQRSRLDDVERGYISLLRPVYNVSHKPTLPADSTPIFAEAQC